MLSTRNLCAALGIVLVLIYAIGSGAWVNTGDGWYQSLNSPRWQPPDWVFGVIWPYNFIVLGVLSVVLSRRLSLTTNFWFLLCFLFSVIAALTWAYQFYRPHELVIASIALSLVAIFTAPMLYLAFRTGWQWGLLLLPYQIWVALAANLSWAYSRLN